MRKSMQPKGRGASFSLSFLFQSFVKAELSLSFSFFSQQERPLVCHMSLRGFNLHGAQPAAYPLVLSAFPSSPAYSSQRVFPSGSFLFPLVGSDLSRWRRRSPPASLRGVTHLPRLPCSLAALLFPCLASWTLGQSRNSVSPSSYFLSIFLSFCLSVSVSVLFSFPLAAVLSFSRRLLFLVPLQLSSLRSISTSSLPLPLRHRSSSFRPQPARIHGTFSSRLSLIFPTPLLLSLRCFFSAGYRHSSRLQRARSSFSFTRTAALSLSVLSSLNSDSETEESCSSLFPSSVLFLSGFWILLITVFKRDGALCLSSSLQKHNLSLLYKRPEQQGEGVD